MLSLITGDNFKRIFKSNSILTLILRLIGIAFIFLTTFIFTHKFDPKIVGFYDFTRSYQLVFGSFCMLASDQTILYLLGKHGNTRQSIIDIYKKVFVVIIVLCFLFNIIGYLLLNSDIIPVDSITKTIVVKTNLTIIFYCIYLVNVEVFRALNKTVFSETLRNIIKYVPILIGFYFVNSTNKPLRVIDYYIYGFVFIALFSSVILYVLVKKKEEERQVTKLFDSTKEIVKYSIPIAFSTISIYLISSIDIFFIKYFKGSEYVAYYAVAVKIISIINVAINAISLSVATDIAYSYTNKDIESLKKIIKKTGKIIFYFSFLASIFLLLFHAQILCIFGKQYIISKNAFVILLVGNLVMSISGNTYIYLLMTNKGIIMLKLLITAVLINVVLNFILIPKFGIEGAAVTSIISILFWNFLGAFYIYKKDKINILFNFKRG